MSASQLNKSGPVPIYEQIIEWMQSKVRKGEWPVNHQLKSEEDLAKELTVSRGTVRKSIRELVRKGILLQVHGRGTFVASSKLEQPLAQRLISFAEAMKEQGLCFRTAILEKRIIKPSERIAAIIRENDEVLYLKRIRFDEHETPIILLENYIKIDLCPQLIEVDLAKNTLFDAIENICNLKIEWGSRRFEAQVSDREKASLLKIDPASPLLYLEQVVYINQDIPIECSDVWIRGDKFRLTSIIRR